MIEYGIGNRYVCLIIHKTNYPQTHNILILTEANRMQ